MKAIGRPFFLRKSYRKGTVGFLLAAAALGVGVIASGGVLLDQDANAGVGSPASPLTIPAADPVSDIHPALRDDGETESQPMGALASLCLDPCDLLVAGGKGAPKLNALALMYGTPGPKDNPLALAMGLNDAFDLGKGVIGDEYAPPKGFSPRYVAAIASRGFSGSGGSNPGGTTAGGGTLPPTSELIPPTDETVPPTGGAAPPTVETPPGTGVLPPLVLDLPGDGDSNPPPLETPLPGAFALFFSALAGFPIAKRRRKS